MPSKFTPQGGSVDIRLRTGKDSTLPKPLQQYAEITVTDSGIGIAPKETEHIFERFYQIRNSQNNSNIGTGIGLHLTRSLVELHQRLKLSHFAAPKTAEFANVLSALSIDSKVLVIVEEGNKFAELSARNLANVTVATPATASVLDIVNADKLLVTKEAILINRGGSCIIEFV